MSDQGDQKHSADQWIDHVCDAFESAWRGDKRPRLEEFLGRAPVVRRQRVLRELLAIECYWRRRLGETPNVSEYVRRFPEDVDTIRVSFSADEETAREFPAPSTPIRRDGLFGVERPSRLGDYELLRVLGQGGMGVVYRARQLGAGRIVALKAIRAEFLTGDPEMTARLRSRFAHEARARRRLQHDNVVSVYDVGEADGTPYYSMQYIEGRDLAELSQVEPLEHRRAAQFMVQAARGVHAAHLHGVLHRDLKPANILVESATDRVRVADFGLAKFAEGTGELTRSGEIMGTPAYMSPEQARGSANATTLSDVYSLGATFHHLLTGQPPLAGIPAVEIIRRLLDDEPMVPRTMDAAVDRDLQTICLKCLEKDPRRRYESAGAVADDLERYLRGEPIQARPAREWERAWKWIQRHRALAGLLAVSVMAPLLLLVFFFAFNLRLQGALGRVASSELDLRRRSEELTDELYESGVALANQHWLAHRWDAASRALDACPADRREWRWELLDRLSRGHTREMSGHAPSVNDLKYSSDGRYLATVGGDTAVRLWSVADGRKISIRSEFQRHVQAVAFSRDGRMLFAAGDDVVRTWTVEDGKPATAFPHQGAMVSGLAIHPDGRRIATCSIADPRSPARMTLWDVTTGRPTTTWEGPNPPRPALLAFTPDGDRLVGVDAQGGVTIWDGDTGQTRMSSTIPNAMPQNIAMSPQGGWLAIASLTGSAGLVDTETGEFRAWLPAEIGTHASANHVAFSRDGALVASATVAGEVRLYQVDGGALWRTLAGAGRHVAFDPTADQLATISQEDVVKIWDLAAGRDETRIDVGVGVVAACLTGASQTPVVATMDGRLIWFNGRGGAPTRSVVAHDASLREMAIGRAGHVLVTCGSDPRGGNCVRVWDAESGELRGEPHGGAEPDPAAGQGGARPVELAISDNERVLAVGGYLGEVLVWDLEQARTIAQWKPHVTVSGLAVSPDGRLVASGGMERTARVWTSDGRQSRTLQTAEDGASEAAALISVLAFSPDGELLAGTGPDRVVRLWRTSDGRLMRTIRLVNPPYRDGLLFSPDGHSLVTVELRRFEVRNASPVLADGVVRVWRVRDGRELLTLPSEEGFGGVFFGPDGQAGRKLGAFHASSVRVWRLDADAATPAD